MRVLARVEIGFVVRRDDPDGNGRVKISVPGVIEGESPNWAEPLGMPGGGSAHRGTFDPPAVGATVGVLFRGGDPDHPFYLCGPYGAPGGTSDVPTGAEVEGDDRAVAVTEDPAWLIQRDSTTAAAVQRWRVKHKSSSSEIVVEGDDHVRLTREGATQALVRGTEYRTAETSGLSDMVTAMNAIVSALNAIPTDPAFAVMFPALAGTLTLFCGTDWPGLKAALDALDLVADPTAYLSDKAFTE